MLTLSTLKTYSPFDALDPCYLEEAMSYVEVESYPQGTMVFKRGRMLPDHYFLLEGDVDLIDCSFQSAPRSSHDSDPLVESRTTLNPESPSRCSCIVKSSRAVFIRIDSQILDRLLAWNDSAEDALMNEIAPAADAMGVEELNADNGNWMSWLLQTPLFSRIPATQVQELFLRLEDVAVSAGDVILSEGQQGDYFYVIADGRAEIKKRTDNQGCELSAGQYFGEEALLGKTLRNATVTMLTTGRLKRLGLEDFNALLKTPVVRYIETRFLKKLDKPYKLLDVKMPVEYRAHHFPESVNLPLTRLRKSIASLDAHDTYVVTDDAGGRADIAAHLLCQAGYDALILKTG